MSGYRQLPITPYEVPDPLATAEKYAQLTGQRQVIQENALKLKDQQAAMRDDELINQELMNGGTLGDIIPRIRGKVRAGTWIKLHEADQKIQEAHRAALDAQDERALKITAERDKQQMGAYSTAMSMPDEQYASTVPQLAQIFGLPPEQIATKRQLAQSTTGLRLDAAYRDKELGRRDAAAKALVAEGEAANIKEYGRREKPNPTVPPHVTRMVGGQPHIMERDPATGEYSVDRGIAPPNYAMIAPDVRTVQIKDETGRNVVQTVRGKTLGELPDTATSRTMAQMAQTVEPQLALVGKEVDDIANQIGPGAGRWNDWWVNKAGIDDPAFAALDTDLDLLSSAIVRTHFGARGGIEYQKALKKRFTSAQSPADLKARIAHAGTWIEGYAKMAGPTSRNATTRFTDGGVNYLIPKDDVQEFLKDHPNARR